MANDVERYYNANTRRFLRFGKGGRTGAIHRAVWAPGVAGQSDALDYVYSRIEAVFAEHDASRTHILDLGCGTGAGMARLARTLTGRFTGITLSPVQAEIGRQRFIRPYSDRVSIEVGDFADPSFYDRVRTRSPVTGIYMIESLAHAPRPAEVLGRAGTVAARGAVLAVCDDMPEDNLPDTTRIELKRYMDGWHIGSVLTAGRVIEYAESAGFRLLSNDDLTAHTAMNRPRDRLTRLLVRLPAPFHPTGPGWDNLVGGTALQTLELRGYVRYRLLFFSKR